ncbi:MAG TPA: hypothetical protein VK961_27200 [Chthoniobacter sp.]|nr:hypothetical protein [Chthoniobacter sp.]
MIAFLTLACSGPGASSTIATNVFVARFCTAIVAVVTLVILYDGVRHQRWSHSLWIGALMLLLHPAWTFDAYGGDCGSSTRDAALTVTAIYAFLLIKQHFTRRTVAPLK